MMAVTGQSSCTITDRDIESLYIELITGEPVNMNRMTGEHFGGHQGWPRPPRRPPPVWNPARCPRRLRTSWRISTGGDTW
jgi:hypothetical protein